MDQLQRSTWRAAMLAGALAGSPLAGATQPVPSSAGGAERGTSATPAAVPAAVSERSLVEWGASIRAEIEAITGAWFTADVPIKVASLDDLAQMLAEPISARMTADKAARPDGKPMSEVEVRIRSMAAAFKVATRTFGVYRYEDKTVYVVPENAARYAKRHGWSIETQSRVPKLAIAHELVHALQDQNADSGARLSKLSGEERSAMIAVIEGHAIWATDRLAERLDWPAANAVLWAVVTGAQTDDHADKAGRPRPPENPPNATTYDAGRKFIERQMAIKADSPEPVGLARVWEAVKNPPRTMTDLRQGEAPKKTQ